MQREWLHVSAEARERKLHEEQLLRSKEQLRYLGAVLIDWHNTDRAHGVYGDFAHWHGRKTDFASLEDLKYEELMSIVYYSNEKPMQIFLSLKGSNFGSDEVHYLREIKCLTYIDLTDTEVTDTGIAELQRDLPSLTIIRTAAAREELARSPDTRWIRRLPGYAKAPQDIWAPHQPFPAVPAMQPAHITILSGTTLLISGKRCKLLGIEDSADPAVQRTALDFATTWLKSTENYVSTGLLQS
jgi:hypothetical protein